MGKIKDIKGNRYGALTAVKYIRTEWTGHNNVAVWKFKCDCGNEFERRSAEITRVQRHGGIRSCGCLYGKNQYTAKAKGIDSRLNDVYLSYKNSKTAKTLGFVLTKNDVEKLIKQNCYYCGQEPKTEAKSKSIHATDADTLLYNGIDRIVNSIGYMKENCVPCCWECNRMKSNMNGDDFIAKILKIANTHNTV